MEITSGTAGDWWNLQRLVDTGGDCGDHMWNCGPRLLPNFICNAFVRERVPLVLGESQQQFRSDCTCDTVPSSLSLFPFLDLSTIALVNL